MTIKIGDRIPAATLDVLKDGVQTDFHREIFNGQEGRAVLRARRVHADLLGQASARLRRALRRVPAARRRRRLPRGQRRLRDGCVGEDAARARRA